MEGPLDMIEIKNDGTIDKTKYTYNSGAMAHCATELFLITGENVYLKEAQRIVLSAFQNFFPENDGEKQSVRTDIIWFDAVFFRALVSLYNIDGNEKYISRFLTNINNIWEHFRDENGLVIGKSQKSESAWLLDQAGIIEIYSNASIVFKK